MFRGWAAALIHDKTWSHAAECVTLGESTRLVRADYGGIGDAYRALRRKGGVHEVYHWDAEVAALVVPSGSGTPPDQNIWDPLQDLPLLCNLVTIATGNPSGNIIVLWSSNEFATAEKTAPLSEPGVAFELLQGDLDRPLDDEAIRVLQKMWSTMALRRAPEHPFGRAVVAYFNTWRSQYLAEMCLHLGVALNALGLDMGRVWLPPTHPDAGEFERGLLEKGPFGAVLPTFFEHWSAVCRGRAVDQIALAEIVPKVFTLVTDLLRWALTDDCIVHAYDQGSPAADLILRRFHA